MSDVQDKLKLILANIESASGDHEVIRVSLLQLFECLPIMTEADVEFIKTNSPSLFKQESIKTFIGERISASFLKDKILLKNFRVVIALLQYFNPKDMDLIKNVYEAALIKTDLTAKELFKNAETYSRTFKRSLGEVLATACLQRPAIIGAEFINLFVKSEQSQSSFEQLDIFCTTILDNAILSRPGVFDLVPLLSALLENTRSRTSIMKKMYQTVSATPNYMILSSLFKAMLTSNAALGSETEKVLAVINYEMFDVELEQNKQALAGCLELLPSVVEIKELNMEIKRRYKTKENNTRKLIELLLNHNIFDLDLARKMLGKSIFSVLKTGFPYVKLVNCSFIVNQITEEQIRQFLREASKGQTDNFVVSTEALLTAVLKEAKNKDVNATNFGQVYQEKSGRHLVEIIHKDLVEIL